VSKKLTFTCVEAIADGRRLPTFHEVQALAGELLELRDIRTLLRSALHRTQSDLAVLRADSQTLRVRERVWRSYLEPETWTMLDQLARVNTAVEPVEAGEA